MTRTLRPRRLKGDPTRTEAERVVREIPVVLVAHQNGLRAKTIAARAGVPVSKVRPVLDLLRRFGTVYGDGGWYSTSVQGRADSLAAVDGWFS